MHCYQLKITKTVNMCMALIQEDNNKPTWMHRVLLQLGTINNKVEFNVDVWLFTNDINQKTRSGAVPL